MQKSSCQTCNHLEKLFYSPYNSYEVANIPYTKSFIHENWHELQFLYRCLLILPTHQYTFCHPVMLSDYNLFQLLILLKSSVPIWLYADQLGSHLSCPSPSRWLTDNNIIPCAFSLNKVNCSCVRYLQASSYRSEEIKRACSKCCLLCFS